jgi:hypothetical protein
MIVMRVTLMRASTLQRLALSPPSGRVRESLL